MANYSRWEDIKKNKSEPSAESRARHPYFRSGVEMISGQQRTLLVNVSAGQQAQTGAQDNSGQVQERPTTSSKAPSRFSSL